MSNQEELDVLNDQLTLAYRDGYRNGYEECMYDMGKDSLVPITSDEYQDKLASIFATTNKSTMTVVFAEEIDDNDLLLRLRFED